MTFEQKLKSFNVLEMEITKKNDHIIDINNKSAELNQTIIEHKNTIKIIDEVNEKLKSDIKMYQQDLLDFKKK